ncbi:hypothetical protein GCM10010442_56770 [Kitasatospora kifunensis]
MVKTLTRHFAAIFGADAGLRDFPGDILTGSCSAIVRKRRAGDRYDGQECLQALEVVGVGGEQR